MTRPMRRGAVAARRRTSTGGGGGDPPPPPSDEVSDWAGPVSATTDPPPASGGAADVVFPSNAGHVNVKNAPYNAVGNGVADDTNAILNALLANDYQNSSSNNPHIDRPAARTVYLPEGTYQVTDSLVFPGCGVRIIGAGEGKTIIKLANNATGFGSAGTPKYLLRTGLAGVNDQENSGFANYIHHLTLDIGSGNPGAIGCRYSVANSGSMRHVTIKSSDATKRGVHGLMFGTTAGPGYVADVTIDGFDNGIYTEDNSVNDIALSNITLTNQRNRSILHSAKCLVFENLTISGAPIEMNDANAMLMIDKLTMSGPGSGTAMDIVANGYLWVRDVNATGWSNLITTGTTNRFSGRTAITEWSSVSYRRGNTTVAWTENTGYVGLHLPMTRAPEYLNDNLAQWARPQDFGYGGSGDAGPAIQAAIDSGAKVVYLPYARYTISSPVVVRGAVRLIECMFSIINKGTGGSWTFGNVNDGEVIMQDFVPDGNLTLIHNSPDTVVVRDNGNRNSYQTPVVETGSSATGDLFFESAGANQRVVINRPINVWLRQINRERAAGSVAGGATVRVFGDNVELSDTDIEADYTISDSTFELVGATFDALGFPNAYPTAGKAAFTITNSNASITTGSYLRSGSSVGHWLRDTEGGSTVGDITNANVYQATTGSNRRVVIPKYVSP